MESKLNVNQLSPDLRVISYNANEHVFKLTHNSDK